jgi:lysophospholipase L1-like esterase
VCLVAAACTNHAVPCVSGRAPTGGTGAPEDVRLIGRFDLADPAGPRFAWPGSAIAARFEGSELSVILDDTGMNQFGVWIDGVARPVLVAAPGANAYELVSGLLPGTHDALIARRTESLFGPTRFGGFPGATLVAAAPPPRTIEFVGDSITCGFGDLGVGPDCAFSADTESEPDAYGALTACALGAAHVAVAYSGRGMFRNYDGSTIETMPILFERTIADEPASAWTFDDAPEILVVNLGTNDFAGGDPGAAYADAYDGFLQILRARYGGAWLVAVTSPMLSGGARDRRRAYLADVVGRAHGRGDARVLLVDLPEQSASDGFGCAFHPTVATHRKVAVALADALRELR